MNSLILVCGGSGTRMKKPVNKLLLDVYGYPIIWYTLKNIFSSNLLDELVLVCKDTEKEVFRNIVSSFMSNVPLRIASGGDTRFQSVRHGLEMLSPDSEKVLVHDGARPFVTGDCIDTAFKTITDKTPAICTAIPCVDTIKEHIPGRAVRTLDRARLFRAQTPQGGLTSLYRKCVAAIGDENGLTDDSSVFEKSGVPVFLIPGEECFFKITTPDDLGRFASMTIDNECAFRIGEAYDIHQLSPKRPLIIGGVHIRDTGGLLGHSDADVLVHAIMDALLGAAALPDIGHFFPDTDPVWEGADSIQLLAHVRDIIDRNGYSIGNVDSTIIAEAPKMSPYIEAMRKCIADTLRVSPGQVNVKATTNEKLDSVGNKKGIAATASVLIRRK